MVKVAGLLVQQSGIAAKIPTLLWAPVSHWKMVLCNSPTSVEYAASITERELPGISGIKCEMQKFVL